MQTCSSLSLPARSEVLRSNDNFNPSRRSRLIRCPGRWKAVSAKRTVKDVRLPCCGDWRLKSPREAEALDMSCSEDKFQNTTLTSSRKLDKKLDTKTKPTKQRQQEPGLPGMPGKGQDQVCCLPMRVLDADQRSSASSAFCIRTFLVLTPASPPSPSFLPLSTVDREKGSSGTPWHC